MLRKKVSVFLIFTVVFQYFSFPISTQIMPFEIAYADATASCSYTNGGVINSEMGQDATFGIQIDNTNSTPGFKPVIEVILPPNIPFSSASLAEPSIAISPSQSYLITDDDGGDPATGDVTNEITDQVIEDLPVGYTYYIFELPFGSFTPSQPSATLNITATLPGSVAHEVPLAEMISSQCSFAFGDDDPLNNPTVDAPVVSGFIDASVEPFAINLAKSVSNTNGDEDEVSTGENFPFTYQIDINVSNGEQFTNLELTDNVPVETQVTSIVSAQDDGNGCSINLFYFGNGSSIPDETTTCSSLPYAPSFPGPGGRVEVVYNQIDGDTSSSDANLQIEVFIPEIDANGLNVIDPLTGSIKPFLNTADIVGDHTGFTSITDTLNSPINANAESITLQKSVSISSDIAPLGEYNPGDTVEYTLDFQVSDFFDLDDAVIVDIMNDGLDYVSSSASLTFSENGTTTTHAFNEATISESNIIPGPPYDFAGNTDCLGCTLAITEDISDDDDLIDPPLDGQTLFMFDISEALVLEGQNSILEGGDGVLPTTGSLTFEALILESYVDTDSVTNDTSIDALDEFQNQATISAQVVSTSNYITDSSSAAFTIVEPEFSKSIVAINDGSGATTTLPNPLEVAPGFDVTYSLTTTIPSGDLEDLSIVDYLPIPFFDVDDFSALGCGFQSSTLATPFDLDNPASIPPACQIGYGDNTVLPGGFPLNTGSTPEFSPTLSIDSGDNSFTIDFNDNNTFDTATSSEAVIEILFTVKAQDEPFGAGLSLANVSQFTGSNSVSPIASNQLELATIITAFPEIEVRKGALSATEDGIATKGALDPVQSSPSEITANLPGSSPSLSFTGPTSSSSMSLNPNDSDISELDAGDIVTFIASLENTGNGRAFDLVYSDSFPDSFATPLSGLNVQAFLGNGTQLTDGVDFTITTGLDPDFTVTFDSSIVLEQLNTDTELGGVDQGENIVFITYDLELQQSVESLQEIENLGSLESFSASSGGNNYVIGQEDIYQDTSITTIDSFSINKDTESTNQSHTSGPDVAIGEIITNSVALNFAEGTIPNLILTDGIPNGLGYVIDNSIRVVDETTDTDTCTAFTNDFNGTIPTFTIDPTGSGLGSSGGDIEITFDNDLVINNDNDPTNNLFCLVYDTVVLDNGNTNNGNNKTNTISLEFGNFGQQSSDLSRTGINTDPSIGERDDRARVTIAEPNLEIEKSLYLDGTTIVPTSIDAGDTLNYVIEVSHNSSDADAFDIEITDDISALPITLNTNFATDGLDNDGDGLTDGADLDELAGNFYNAGTQSFTWNETTTGGNTTEFNQLGLSDTITLSFEFTVDDNVFSGQVLSNTADISYDSLPGDPIAGYPERSYTGDVNIENPINSITASKSISSTNLTATSDTRGDNTIDDLAIGELVTFTIEVEVPESEIDNLEISDTLPDFMRAEAVRVVSTGSGIVSGQSTSLSDLNNSDSINDTAIVSFTSYDFAGSSSQNISTIEIEIDATLLNNPGNLNLEELINTVDVDYTNNPSPIQAQESIEVVIPELNIEKTVSASSGDAEDPFTYTFTISHTANSQAAAFDIELTDIIPVNLTLNDQFSTDGLDNTGSGSNDEVNNGTTAAFWDGATLTLNSSTTGITSFDELPLGSSIVFEFQASANNGVEAGTLITNTASLSYDSFAGPSPDQISLTDSDTADYTVNNIDTISKDVFSTNVPDTNASQFDPTLEDLTIGEEVRYRVTVDIPEATFTDTQITDVLPLGLEPISGSLISDDGVVHSFVSPTLEDNENSDGINDTIIFNFGTVTNNADADTEQIVVEIVAILIDIPNSTPANNPFINTATVSVDGVDLVSDTASVEVVLPNIALNKSVTPLTATSGETVIYTVTMENIGSGPAFDISGTDILPSDLTVVSSFSSDGLDNTGSGSNDESDAPVSFYDDIDTFNFNSTTTSNSSFDALPPGQTITLEYSAIVGVGVQFNDNLINNFNLSYDTFAGTDPNSNEKTFSDNDDAAVLVPFGGDIQKDLRDTDTEKTIGDTIAYRITVTIDQGTTSSLIVEDILPTGLAIIPSSININTNNNPAISFNGSPTSPTIIPSSDTISDGQSQTATFNFGEVINTDTDTLVNEEIYIEYDVVVLNTSDVNSGDTKVNGATADFAGLVQPSTGVANSPTIEINEPNLSTLKTNNYISGDEVTYRINLFQTENNKPSAYDINIKDIIASDLTYDGNITSINGPLPTVDLTNYPTVNFQIPEVNSTFTAANPLVFEYTVEIDLINVSVGSIDNTASTSWTSQNGLPVNLIALNPLSNQRTGDSSDPGGVQNDNNSNSTSGIILSRPDLSTSTKTVLDLNGGDIQGNDILEYTITLRNTGNLAGTGIRVEDVIPENVNNLTIISTPVGSIDNSDPSGGVNSTGIVDIDNISIDEFGGLNDTITIVYQVTVDNDLSGGIDIVNNLTVFPSIEGGRGATDTTTSTSAEPILTVSKVASESITNPNQPFIYTISVTNEGSSESINTTISDLLPNGISYIPETMTLNDGTTTSILTDTNDADEADFDITNPETLTVIIPTISPAQTYTFEFQAQVSSRVSSGYTNTVAVSDTSGNLVDASVTTTSSGSGSSSSGGGGGSPFSSVFEDNQSTVRSCSLENSQTIFYDEYIESCFELVSDREIQFSDVDPQSSAAPFINTLKNTRIISEGDFIVSGTDNHSSGKQQDKFQIGTWEFQPNRSLTRLEAIKIALISNCIPIEDDIPVPENGFNFEDVPTVSQEDEAQDFISRVMYTAYKNGIIQGYEDGLARPLQKATVLESLALSLRAAQAIPENFESKSPGTEEWFTKYVNFSRSNGIYGQEVSDLNQEIDRATFSTIAVRVMGYNPNPSIHSYIERVNIFDQTYNSNARTFKPSPSIEGFAGDEVCEVESDQEIVSCLEYDSSRPIQFDDIQSNSWYSDQIEFLKNTKIRSAGDYIVSGVGNHSTGKQQEKFQFGTWNYFPENTTSNLELVKIALVSNCIPLPSQVNLPSDGFRFADIDLDSNSEVDTLSAKVFYTAYNNGIWTKEMGDIANPFEDVTRSKAIGVFAQAALDMEDLNLETSIYNDLESDWYTQSVLNSYKLGIIDQYGTSNFNANRTLKRSEVSDLATKYMLFNKDKSISNYTKIFLY